MSTAISPLRVALWWCSPSESVISSQYRSFVEVFFEMAKGRVNKIVANISAAVRVGNKMAYVSEEGKQWRVVDQRRANELRREKRRSIRLAHRDAFHDGA